ncbi:MAG TPA: arginine--tRNA ligase [Acidimicrobiales bacterium]|nr:arginine--tRNA ligase [Acidimicrobiales bacterium]
MAGLPELLAAALQPAFDLVEPGADPVVRPSSRPGIDFQANGAMAVGKRSGRPPAEVAGRVAAAGGLEGVATLEVAPQGFINIHLDEGWLAGRVAALAADPRLGVATAAVARTMLVDYSSPNVAKEMHVGHLRSTVIGDALVRMLEFAGHRVIKENHVGDWGTQFGMLIEHLLDLGEEAAAQELSVGDLDGFYRQARAAFDASEEFQDRSRRRVVLLQSGDAETNRLWRILVDQSLAYFDEMYARLGVLLTSRDVVGESSYNPLLPVVVEELAGKGLLVDSAGAKCVFPPGFTGRDGEPLPLIVQKSDGGYGYATSDMAALKDRFGRMGVDQALYVVGSPQSQHFAMCFAAGVEAGYLPAVDRAVHIAFGSVLGPDRKMLKTRSGETVKLVDLLDQAQARAAAVVAERGELSDEEQAKVARMVAMGAVKYADLSTDRIKDYVFDLDRMVTFDGNTAPYLQYARVRCLSIFRRAERDAATHLASGVPLLLSEPGERALALGLLGFVSAVDETLTTWSPHKLCTYLFDLAGLYTSFFESCPVLKAPTPELRDSRLVLCALTADVLGRGLDLLGIDTPERM